MIFGFSLRLFSGRHVQASAHRLFPSRPLRPASPPFCPHLSHGTYHRCSPSRPLSSSALELRGDNCLLRLSGDLNKLTVRAQASAQSVGTSRALMVNRPLRDSLPRTNRKDWGILPFLIGVCCRLKRRFYREGGDFQMRPTTVLFAVMKSPAS